MASDLGTLISWNAVDGVGRIRLDTAEELRVGQGALGYGKPSVGQRCEVTQIEAHPLGGRRATTVRLLDERVPVSAPVATEVDRSGWLLERIGKSVDGAVANVEVQGLLDAYLVFSGRAPKPQVFGVSTAQVSRGQWPQLAAAAERALRGWKAKLAAQSPRDAYLLDKAGRDLKLEFLQGPKVELRCEPLGTLDGLNPDWVARLNRLKKQLKKRPALECFGLEDARKVHWGKPDRAALREAALAWEAANEASFPREFAALACIADGLFVDGEPVIRPIADWTDNDDGVEIGQGSYMQGNLTMLPDGQVIDRDDDQVEMRRFPSFGALIDALLAG
ncbi:MAG: hypothetical protein AB1938_28610 [Myxococcota bacterium]